jgi:rfaE bifunctional protein kinase chain/domain
MDIKISIDNILGILDRVGECKVTVFGDFALDKYLYIDPAREEISVETGLPAHQVDGKAVFPGAAGTIVNNLRSLGVRVSCVGMAGGDGEGYDLLNCLEKIGAETKLMVRSDKIQTYVYMKPMRLSAGGTYVEMNRFDFRNFKETPRELEDMLLANLEASLADSSGAVICDQYLEPNNATVTERIRKELARIAGRHPKKTFYADSRGFTGSYRDVIIKCNQSELSDTIKGRDGMHAQAKELLAANGKAVVVTAGADGAYVFEGETTTHIPPFPVDGPIDITGAGDATNAGAITGLVSGLSLQESVLLGGCISSITIRQLGVTGTATVAQVKELLSAANI